MPERIRSHRCPGCKHLIPCFGSSHQLPEAIHAAVKLLMVLKNRTDRGTVGKDFFSNLPGKSLGIQLTEMVLATAEDSFGKSCQGSTKRGKESRAIPILP